MSGLRTRREGAVLVVTFDRVDKKNALTGAMYDGLRAALAGADADAEIGAVLIEGSDGIFTAGNDIGDFLASAHGFADSPAIGFIRQLIDGETPIVAAVDGVAVGVGTTLLLHCDLVYATARAQLRLPFVDLGLVPEAAASLVLPQRVGLARASELLLLAEAFDGVRAHELGLVNVLVVPDALSDIALSAAQRLAAKPREALRATRRLLRGDKAEVLARFDEEVSLFAAALRSPEAQAAFASFLARGKKG